MQYLAIVDLTSALTLDWRAQSFALLMLQPWVRQGARAAVGLLLGAALGFASLAAYFWSAPSTESTLMLPAPPEIVARIPLGAIEKGIR